MVDLVILNLETNMEIHGSCTPGCWGGSYKATPATWARSGSGICEDGDYFNDLFEFNIPEAHWTRGVVSERRAGHGWWSIASGTTAVKKPKLFMGSTD